MVCNQPRSPTQPTTVIGMEMGTVQRAVAMLFGCSSDFTFALHHRLCSISIYWLSGLRWEMSTRLHSSCVACHPLPCMQYVASASMICSSTKMTSVQHDTASLPSMTLTLGGKAVVRNRRSQKPTNCNAAEKEVFNRFMFTTCLSQNKAQPSGSTM